MTIINNKTLDTTAVNTLQITVINSPVANIKYELAENQSLIFIKK